MSALYHNVCIKCMHQMRAVFDLTLMRQCSRTPRNITSVSDATLDISIIVPHLSESLIITLLHLIEYSPHAPDLQLSYLISPFFETTPKVNFESQYSSIDGSQERPITYNAYSTKFVTWCHITRLSQHAKMCPLFKIKLFMQYDDITKRGYTFLNNLKQMFCIIQCFV